MMLNRKLSLLKKLLRRECDYYLKENPQFLTSLDAIRTLRNILAHSTVDVSNETLAIRPIRSIGFVYYKDGERRVKTLTLEEAQLAQAQRQVYSNDVIS